MSARPTGAQLSAGIRAILPALAKIQAIMASPQFKDTVVITEDVLKILAAVDVPGAAAVEDGIEIAADVAPAAVVAARLAVPVLADALPAWLAGGLFAPNPSAPRWLGAPNAI